MTYSVLQLKENCENIRSKIFAGVAEIGGIDCISAKDYQKIYDGMVNKTINIDDKKDVSELLELIFTKHNMEMPPETYQGHSLSMSDIIVLDNNTIEKAYYCDTIGFATLPDKFVKDWRNQERIKVNEQQQDIAKNEPEIDI